MKTKLLAAATVVAVAHGMPPEGGAQEPARPQPTVPLVKTVGCVERDGESWFLTRATDPEVTEYPFASAAELEDAGRAGLGSNRLQLVGVADFLDAEGLLALPQRAAHTTPESVNATGALAAGRKVAVKGLYITGVEPHRVNLTSLLSLADECG